MTQTETRDYKAAVGGMWDEIGQLQFDFLVAAGLQPQHRLLDMGCGSLRGGVKFMPYLDEGNYYGIDKERWLLNAGHAALFLEQKTGSTRSDSLNLSCRADFNAHDAFGGVQFDFVLAQSLFTHLPPRDIGECMRQVRRVLKPKTGRFFATYFRGQRPPEETLASQGDPYKYQPGNLSQLAEGAGLASHHHGGWNHPRKQMMMVLMDVAFHTDGTPIQLGSHKGYSMSQPLCRMVDPEAST